VQNDGINLNIVTVLSQDDHFLTSCNT